MLTISRNKQEMDSDKSDIDLIISLIVIIIIIKIIIELIFVKCEHRC